MTKYELTVVLAGSATSAKRKTTFATVESIIKIFKGKIVNKNDIGEIGLAYKINKGSTGYFFQYVLELDESGVDELSRKIEFEEDIIRHLLVKTRKEAKSK